MTFPKMKSILAAAAYCYAAVQVMQCVPTSAVAADVLPICTNQRLEQSTILAPTTLGESYAADRCFIQDNVLLNVSGLELPVVANSTAATAPEEEGDNGEQALVVANKVHFTFGTLGVDAAFIIHMPIDASASPPIDVYINSTTFGSNAAIRFLGSLSAHSRITIENNIFDLVDRNPYMQDVAMVSAFSIPYIQTAPLQFCPNASLVVRSNQMKCTLVGESTQGFQQFAAVPISCLNGYQFYPNAKVIIDDNALIAQCTPTEQYACAYGIMWTTIIEGQNATCSVSGNKFNVNRGIAGFTPVLNGYGMTGRFNNNSGTVVSTNLHEAYNGVLKIRTGQLYVRSSFEVKHNEFEAEGVATGLIFEPATVVFGASRVEVAHNKIRSIQGASPSLYPYNTPFISFADQVYASADSQVWVYGNILESTGDRGFLSAAIQFHNPITVAENSDVCVFGNEVIGALDNATDVFIEQLGDVRSVHVDNTSMLSFSNNSYKGKLVFGQIALNMTSSSAIGAAASASPCGNGCPVVNPSASSISNGFFYTPNNSTDYNGNPITTQPTTATTTTEALHSNMGSGKVVTGAMCGLLAMALLTSPIFV